MVWMANVHRHAKLRQNRPKGFGDITIFRFSKWRPSAILDFQNFNFFVASQVGRTNVHRRTQFHQNRSNGCRDTVFNDFQNGGRPPSWILDI